MTTLETHKLEQEQTDALKREQYLKDVLITAVEGGTGYWAQVSKYDPDRGTVILWENESDEAEPVPHQVNLGVIERGIRLIFAGQTNIARYIREDVIVNSVDNDYSRGDAETADCIVQVGLFGKLVYG